MNEIPLPLLIILIIAAVIAGLWVGWRANDRMEASRAEDAKGKRLGTRARELATRSAVSLWRWNRERQRKSKPAPEGERK